MIRKARESDLAKIVEMSEKFYPQTKYIHLTPFNPMAAAVLASALIDNGIMLVAELESKVVGMIGLVVTSFPFDPTILGAYEIIWWVEPEAQSLGVGKALLEAIDPVAKEMGASFIHMVCMADSPIAAAALYIKSGYDHTEMSFTKRI
jgi:GNAT superfamily N-acetyltransferase